MPQLEPPLATPSSHHHDTKPLQQDSAPKPLSFSVNITKLDPSTIGNLTPVLGQPKVASKTDKHFTSTSATSPKTPQNPFIPFSKDNDDLQSVLTPHGMMLFNGEGETQERQLKAIIPSPADPVQEQPSFQDIRDMVEFSKKPKPPKKTTQNGKYPHLLVHLSFENTSGLTILDDSGSGHNAKMSGAILIRPNKGKCSSFVTFKGGKILFDSKVFQIKPRKAITVALWIKLDNLTGSVSLFSVQRSTAGQGGKLDLRISTDMVWWAHVDENRKLIFDVNTHVSSDITSGHWIHVAATYDSTIRSAKVVVNGRFVNEIEASGLLSQQWLGDVGIGLLDSFHGNVDEFYLFDRALTTPEIDHLRHKCHTFLVSASKSFVKRPPKLPAKHRTIPTTNATSSNKCSRGIYHVHSTLEGGRNAGRFDYKGHAVNVLECLNHCCDVKDCDLAYMDASGSCYSVHCKNKELCRAVPAIGGATSSVFFVSRSKHIMEGKVKISKKHSTKVNATIAGLNNKTSAHSGGLLSETSILNKDSPQEECRSETVFFNVDLKGGLSANSFKRYRQVTSMETCLGHCCNLGDCDVALVKNGDCFAVHCSTHELCRAVEGSGKLARVLRPATGKLAIKSSNQTAKALVLYFGFHDVSKKKILDGSGRHNDGKLSEGAKIIPYSRHGPGLDLTKGGAVLLDGLSFQGKPRDGVSMATWVKLSSIQGNHAIFSMISNTGRLSRASYSFEIQDGRIRWSHRNAIGNNVFMVVSPLLIGPNIWYHVVVTYDSLLEKAKVIVNGQVKAVGHGRGKLSEQWGESVYLGSNSKESLFNGFLDEVYIFKRPLHKSEVRRYLSNMDTKNYGLNNISGVSHRKTEKDFPSIATSKRPKNVENSTIISHHMLNNSAVIGAEMLHDLSKNSSKILDKGKQRSHTLNKNSNSKNETNFKGLLTELKDASSPEVENTCAVNGTVYNKWTFRGGLKSGKFFKMADISNMTDCIAECCKRKSCDVAIMKGSTCFSLKCRSKKLCELRPARLSTFDLKIAFVKRNHGQSDDGSSLHSNQCIPGIRIANVTINAGIGAGQVVQYRNISNIDQCVNQCCFMPKCNTAFLVQDTCYTIACVIRDFCKVRPPPSADFYSEVVYVNRSGAMLFSEPQYALMLHSNSIDDKIMSKHLMDKAKNSSNSTATKQNSPDSHHKPALSLDTLKAILLSNLKNHPKQNLLDSAVVKNAALKLNVSIDSGKGRVVHNLTESNNTELECRIEKILTDVKLAGDLNAGVFVDHGKVKGIKSCIMKCCDDPRCNVTYLIGMKCFAVRCHSPELCRSVPAPHMSLSPTIAFVRQEKLKVSHHIVSEQIRNHKGRPRLKNLLRAWRKLQRYKKLKNERLKMANHALRLKTVHKTKHKAKHKSKHRNKLKLKEAKGKVLKHNTRFPHHGHKDNNSTRHGELLSPAGGHVTNVKDVKTPLHNTSANMKKAQKVHCPRNFGCQYSCIYLADIGYRCTCPPAFNLAFDGRHCIKRNKCMFGWHRCQQVCVQLRGRFQCECHPGYTLNKDGRHCDDIDECLLGIGRCSQHCENLPGNYLCTCKKGFSLKADNKTCENKHTHSPTTKSQLNKNTLTAPVEVAVQFSEMKILQGQRAILNCRARGIPQPRIKWASGNDGAFPLPSNPRFKISPANSLIIDSTNISDSGTFYCIASNIIESKAKSVKLDILDEDECLRKKHPVCKHKCINTKGSYRCSCHHGYKLHHDSHSCEDIDECSISNHTCSHACNNTLGSFSCSCPAGYQLIHDDHMCTDIDECSSAAHNCSQLCRNTAGGYQCSCVQGYHLSVDNSSCHSETSSSKKVEHGSMTKAIGAFVAVVTISILSMVAIAMLVGGLYNGRRKVNLDEDEDEHSTLRPGSKTALFSWLD